MRIIFVQDSLGTGGAERSNADLWYYLKEQPAVELKIVVLEQRSVGIQEEIIEAGFDVVFLEGNFLSQVKDIVAIIKDFKPNLVQSVLFKSAMRVRMAKQFKSFFHLEYIVNCSYSEIRYKDPKINNFGLTFFKYLNRYSQPKGVDHFVALTNEVKNHAITHLRIKPEKISVISRGRASNPHLQEKPRLREKIRMDLDIGEDRILFIHVGRQEYQKAQIDLLRAIFLVDKNLAENKVEFIFCGRKGNLSKDIENFLRSHPLKTPLHWLGHRNDIPKLLLSADVFVFPSLFEGLGGALIEAQAAGLPIIASNIEVFNEVIEEGKNALLFQVSNPEDLAKKILLLSRSKEKREEMGECSLENYKRQFQIGKIHKQIFSLYRTLTS